jgi:hypothetical protein
MSAQIKHKYIVGEVVWLKNLKQIASITRFDKKGLLYVNLDGVEIPVFFHDISSYIEPVKYSSAKQEKNAVEESKANYLKYRFDTSKFSHQGILLLFVPETLHDGEIIHYDVLLVNETNEKFQVTYKLISNYGIFEQGKQTFNKNTYGLIAHFNAEHINEMQQLELTVIPENKDLQIENITRKFSAASLVKHEQEYMPMKRRVFCYELLKSFKIKPKTKANNIFDDEHEPFEVNIQQLKGMMLTQPERKEFEVVYPEKDVDLHIEKILSDTGGLTNTDILLTQIEHFNKALDRAIRSGQKVFYAIHGNGSGKLKKEIHKILNDHTQVLSFTDEYTAQYAFGATKIILK